MILKRIGCSVLALVLSLSFSMPISSYASGNFSDTTGHWAEKFISRAYNQNIVGGYPNGKFQPDKPVTRAEFISMINKAIDIGGSSETNFSDVLRYQWYYRDISDAVFSTYASGYSDNTFRPNNPVTRQEAAVMLARILPSYKKGGSLKSFKDSKQIASWATSAMEKMIGRQYLGAYNDGLIHPNDPITRAQTAKILCDILDNETFVKKTTVIDEKDTKLSEKIYVGDVLIDEDLGEGNATIDNCVILGTLTVEGGGSKSITLNNCRIANVLVNKDDSPVRIVTKGDTTIAQLTAKQASILQTSGKNGTGILKVDVNRGADLTLKGNFPVVTVKGSAANVALESGQIATLVINKNAEYSDVTLVGKAGVTEATVNAEAYFHGTGIIAHMSVNADDITYETKPTKMTVGVDIDRAEGEGDSNSDVDVTFEPRNRDDDIDLDTKIVITFSSSMKLANGKAIADSNIKDFIHLLKETKEGASVEVTASINSAKKVITLVPTVDLSPNTRYYIILDKDTLKNASGSENDKETSYFTTGENGGGSTASFSPSNGKTGVSVNTSISVSFSDEIVRSDGGNVTSSYLQECIVLKAGGDSGTNVPFTASISSSKRITVTPTTALAAGQKYYIAVAANKLKTKAKEKAVSAASATWTTAGTTTSNYARLTSLTLSPSGGSNNVLTGFNASTTSYNVDVPFGTTSVDVSASAASGTTVQINGTTTNTAINIPVPSSSPATIKVVSSATGMTATNYDIIVKVAGNTALKNISVDGTRLFAESEPYAANVAFSATSAAISIETVDPNAVIKIGSKSGTGSCTANVDLASGNQKIEFTVTSNNTTKTYSIQFTRLAL